MLLTGKRIRKLATRLAKVPTGTTILVASRSDNINQESLEKAGFTHPVKPGDTVLPAIVGPATERNAEGDYIVHRDKEKETYYTQREWTWEEFRGRYDRVQRTKIVDQERKRYPRTFVPPASVEIRYHVEDDKPSLIATTTYTWNGEDDPNLVQTLNVMLELFGECELLTDELLPLSPRIRRLNWEALPPGEYPWPRIKAAVEPILRQQKPSPRAVIESRLEVIGTLNPEFVAIGRAGFKGYLVFGFPTIGIHVLESTQPDNATYILGDDWEELSNLTKAQILSGSHHEGRVIHRADSWEQEIKEFMEQRRKSA